MSDSDQELRGCFKRGQHGHSPTKAVAQVNEKQSRFQTRVNVRLVPELKNALDQAAKNAGTSRNRLINELLAKELNIELEH